jgi:hypothetical protein
MTRRRLAVRIYDHLVAYERGLALQVRPRSVAVLRAAFERARSRHERSDFTNRSRRRVSTSATQF